MVRAQFREVVLAPSTKFFKDVETSMRNLNEGRIMAPVPKNHFEVSVGFLAKINTFFIYNEDINVAGILTRIPGSEEVYDKMKKELVTKEAGCYEDYRAYFYAIYKGAVKEGPKAGCHMLEINLDKRVVVERNW